MDLREAADTLFVETAANELAEAITRHAYTMQGARFDRDRRIAECWLSTATGKRVVEAIRLMGQSPLRRPKPEQCPADECAEPEKPMLIVIENRNGDAGCWGISFDGVEPDDEHYMPARDRDTANRLVYLIREWCARQGCSEVPDGE